MSVRSELRSAVIERSAGRCEWPSHSDHPGAELAHIHSLAMGGNPDGTRDHLSNVAWLCVAAARVSDGEVPAGGGVEYRRLMIELLGAGVFGGMTVDRRGWERAEALRQHIEDLYGKTETC